MAANYRGYPESGSRLRQRRSSVRWHTVHLAGACQDHEPCGILDGPRIQWLVHSFSIASTKHYAQNARHAPDVHRLLWVARLPLHRYL
ncbi:hypothetical protein [Pandoravirus japonicus]|uniref:Uncharacterized protein n=1 Tax=Pandoravirus japonicus TaxID=2823154 RepID=A0A811BM94_9VIRU|nr:hypothetical protein [Pandoravirus japonicus]